jgi:hypothetical protein
MPATRVCQIGFVLFVSSLAAVHASAQTNEEVWSQFQWNFSTPGARANAMGQAFIGVADDASAAVTNPAGLTALTRREVYAEFKSTDLKVNRLASANSLTTLETTQFGGTINSLSFVDIAAPIGTRTVVAFTRHEFLNYQEHFTFETRLPPAASSSTIGAFFPVDGQSYFYGTSYAGSAAFSVTKAVQVGATVSINQLDVDYVNTRFGTGIGTPAGVIQNQATINDTDTEFAWSVGALFRPAAKFSVGAVYLKGPDFSLPEDFRTGSDLHPFADANPPFPRKIYINVPDRIGGGVAIRPHDRFLVSADAVVVKYSDLVKNFTTILGFSGPPSVIEIDDVTEVHFGGEWLAMTGTNSVFVRAGAFTNPAHAPLFVSNTDPVRAETERLSFNQGRPEGTEVKGTVGVGVAVGRRFQLDAGYVWGRDLVLSAALRF